MRKLLVLLLVLTGLWSGYWYVGSNAIRQGAEDWFAQAATQGLQAENSALSVVGFPNRFDLNLEGLRLRDPASGIGWQAPFLQVFAMTWKPWHIIAALPPEQVVTLPDQEIILTADRLRASFRARPATEVPLAAVIVESGPFTARSTEGWMAGASRAVASISADEEVQGAGDQPNAYVLSLTLSDLAPDPEALDRIAAEAGLPMQIATVRLVATATLTAPLDRFAGQANPQLAGLTLTDSLIAWGDLAVTAQGSIAPDDQGFAAGRIEISVANYQRLVPALVAAGVIKPEIRQTVDNMLAALARETGDPNLIRLPLLLQDGRVSFGPLPLGRAPRLIGPTG